MNMDVSRLTIGEDTSSGVSIYLSFDSNSTMSSIAYKTVEAIGDFSTVSAMELDDVEESTESHQNSTLEAANESHVKTVKKAEVVPLGTAPALRALPKNILQEYKAISSTPTKAQLLRSVDIMRGSEAERGMDLGVAFMRLEDEKHSLFNEENKENALPDSEVSTLSTSGEIATTVIEKKQATLTTTTDQSIKIIEAKASESSMEVRVVSPTPSPNKNMQVDEKKVLPSSSGLRKPKSCIPQKKNNRKSVCEPNLNTNRPSRIASNLKRRTSLAVDQKLAKNDISDIPKLLDKMLKISSNAEVKKEDRIDDNEHPKPRHTTGITQGSSLLLKADKRPFSFTQRMSIVVKTTLNSPARKMARKSLLSIGQPSGAQGRRSVLSTGSSNVSRNIRRSVMPPQRKSMLPTSAQARKTIGNVQQMKQLDKPTNISRENLATKKQMQPLSEKAEPREQNNSKTGPKARKESIAKLTSTFNCSVCSRQFRIKSLLDAHKSSHIDDISPLQPVSNPKKISTSVNTKCTTSNVPNQCKYCDKKFAIVRALNIHLIQNCPKIPPGEKKKLHCTELNHVEKAQLPPVFSSAATSAAPTKMPPKTHSNLSDKKMSSAESLIDKQEIKAKPRDLAYGVDNAMAPPQTTSKLTKKKAAHAGVYRTPSKSVPCHLCKQSFKSILDYTNHSMAMHSTQASNIQVPDAKSEHDGSPRKTIRK